jgi:hypothetical protein
VIVTVPLFALNVLLLIIVPLLYCNCHFRKLKLLLASPADIVKSYFCVVAVVAPLVKVPEGSPP